MGSSPVGVKSPRRRRPSVLTDSSSEEETPNVRNVAHGRSAPKSNQVNVIAQIHTPSQGHPNEEHSPTGVGVDRKENQEQGRSGLIKPNHEESKRYSATTQSSSGITEETVQSGSGTQPLENGVILSDGRTSGSLNHLEEAKNRTAPEMDPLEGRAEKNQVENSGSSLKEESCLVKPQENDHHPGAGQSSESQRHLTEAQNKTTSELDQLESSTEKNEVERSGSTMTEECGVVQPLENGETSVSAITQETLEKTVVVHLHENVTYPQDAQSSRSENNKRSEVPYWPLEGTEKVDGEKSASGLTAITPPVKQDSIQEDAEVSNERDSMSECSWHSKASESRNQSTPFENDASDGSDSDGSIIEDDGKAKQHGKAISGDGASADPKPVSIIDQHQLREGPKKETSIIRPAPEQGFRTIVPIEDEGRSCKGQEGNDRKKTCQTCPARQSCVGTEESKGRQDIRTGDEEGNKQNIGKKVSVQRPSAPVNIPSPRNRLVDKLRDTQSGSGGSKLSDCGSFVTAVGSVHSGNSIESFHSARSGSSSSQSRQDKSKDDSDHHSDVCLSSNDMPHVLPISSSFVDVLCAVNRLTAFACHLCKIFCPCESPQRGEYAAAACFTSEDDDLRNESLGIKRRLCNRLIQVQMIPGHELTNFPL